MNEIVQTKGLTKRYGDFDAVCGLNMLVKEKRIYGFLGPNGAGKSTTLKMLLGLVHPTAGEISLFGKQVTAKNRMEILHDIGSLIETPSYYGHLTAKENLKIFATLLHVPDSNIEEVLKIVRLDRQQNKKTAAFSLGMKQRLGLASALLSFPRLLILDEPTNGLDPAGIQEMRELIKSLPEKYGMTVVVSSHLLSEIDQMAEDIGIIANGKMMYQGELNRLHEMGQNQTLEEIFLDLTGREQSL
ncbi:MAG: ATP-binding cassette domain-containing protein [bacterium]|nr:ATP-binding cassette domain-containing protein [bacterium]